MDVTAEHKTDIERKIVETIATSLEKNELSEEDLPKIAEFILEKIDKIVTHDELIMFLSELSASWPVFTNVAVIEKGEVKEDKEEVVAKDVLQLVKDGQIEEAIGLAKKMTNT